MDTGREQEQLIEALAVTAEVCGTDISKGAAKVMAGDLARFPHNQVMASLGRCRREVKGRLSLADIISRIDDGRPTADQAWCSYPKDESETACITSETQQAMSGIGELLAEDPKSARFAFRDAYEALVQKNRNEGKPVEWRLTLGWDAAGREPVIMEAIALGRISKQEGLAKLPHLSTPVPERIKALIQRPNQ